MNDWVKQAEEARVTPTHYRGERDETLENSES